MTTENPHWEEIPLDEPAHTENNSAAPLGIIASKLRKARKIFHKDKFAKTGKNDRYFYFELADFLPQALEAFDEAGIVGIISFNREEARMKIIDDEGNHDFITSPMSEVKLPGCHPIQNLGAVETYQRRYLWATAIELVESDKTEATKPEEPPLPTRPKHLLAPAPGEQGAGAGSVGIPKPPPVSSAKAKKSEGEELEWTGTLESVTLAKQGFKKDGKTPYERWVIRFMPDEMGEVRQASSFDSKLCRKTKEIFDNDPTADFTAIVEPDSWGGKEGWKYTGMVERQQTLEPPSEGNPY